MEVRSRRIMAAVLALSAWLWSAPGSAWTDARARSARVVVEVDSAAAAWVFVDLSVQVRGGWLEGFEIDGLDPDAMLDPLKPPVLVGEDSQKWIPRATLRRGGRLQLSFGRRDPPRRGRYRLLFAYRTSLAHRGTEAQPGGLTRILWTLPAWETGLEDVEVWVWAPSDRAVPVDAPGLTPSHVRRMRGRSLLRFHRMHLPRATSWPVAFDAPDADLDPALGVERGVSRGGGRATVALRQDVPDTRTTLALWLCTILLYAWWQARRERRTGRPLRFLLGSRARACAASALCLASASWHPEWLWGAAFAALLCGLSRTTHAQQGPRFGRWIRLGARDRERAHLEAWRDTLGLGLAADPLSLLGVGILVAVAVLLAALTAGELDPYGGAAGVFALAFAWSTRRSSRCWARSWMRLFDLAAQLRGGGLALGVRAFQLADGRFVQPRLVVHPAARASGLVRLEVAPDERVAASGWVLMATTTLDSATDRWLGELGAEREISPGAHRVCHLLVAPDVGAVERGLAAILAHCQQSAQRALAHAA